MRQFSIAQLFEDHREKLQLNWIASVGTDRQLELKDTGNYGADIIGHLNLIHSERLQVIGAPEVAWAARHPLEKVAHHMQEIYAAQPPAIIVADDCAINEGVRLGCEVSGTPLLKTPMSSA